MKNYVYGVDVGGTTVKIGLITTTGEIKEKWEIKTNTENNGEKILSEIAQSIIEKNNALGINHKMIVGVGIGVPGPVNSDGFCSAAVNLGWKDKNVKGEMEQLIGLPVAVCNDANAAAMGEMWQGGAKNTKNSVFVTLGTGVGGGVIIDSKLVHGVNGAGGEIGHLCVHPIDGYKCNCGNTGCLETYASATGIVRIAKTVLERPGMYFSDSPKTELMIDNLSAKAVFDLAKNNDEIALKVVDLFATYLGRGLATISAIVDPEVFVIGGGVSKAGQFLIDAVANKYREYAFFATKAARFELATLGNDAGMLGAAYLVLTQVGKGISIMNPKMQEYLFLNEMYEDTYYPAFLVDKGKEILINLCQKIEEEQPKTLEELYKLTHFSTKQFNNLIAEFEDNDSDIDTVARECIGADFVKIAEAYGYEVDVEKIISGRDW